MSRGWYSNVDPPRRVKPAPQKWECCCFDHGGRGLNRRRLNPAYLSNCPDCWARRPE